MLLDKDATYILSKLSDRELIQLLSQEPKRNDYDINDLIHVAGNAKVANALPFDDKTGKLSLIRDQNHIHTTILA